MAKKKQTPHTNMDDDPNNQSNSGNSIEDGEQDLDVGDSSQIDTNEAVVTDMRLSHIPIITIRKKPPVGQGLNKAALVTLLNIKCIDIKTGQQYMEGARAEKYKEMLMKKVHDQGAEFVSYDPIEGDWKFRANHF